MKQRNFFILLATVILLQLGLTYFVPSISAETIFKNTHIELEQEYHKAIKEAAIATSEKKSDQLINITPETPELIWNEDKTKVLVVTWKQQESYEKYIKPLNNTSLDENYLLWVTVAPQLQKFCQQYLKNHPRVTEENLKMRLRQYLGLNPQWQYDLFVEMWVSPQDLFRPCTDPDVTKNQCEPDFPKDINPQVQGITKSAQIKDYKNFFKNLYYSSIRSGKQPWTGLGYTYDWGKKKNHIGASEFIIIPGGSYVINKTEPTWKYCQ